MTGRRGSPRRAPGEAARLPGASLARGLFDWRLALGLAVTGAALYWTLHDVDLREIARSLREADYRIVALAAPFHVIGLWVRALRWRCLTRPIAGRDLPMGPLYRATAVGFMTINVLPLRLGELVRPWLLARETGVRGSAAFGTLLLERAMDFSSLAVIGAIVLYLHTREMPDWVSTGAIVLGSLAAVPAVLAVTLRRAEAATLGVLARVIGLLPERLAEPTLDLVNELCRGLNSLRGAGTVAEVVLWSALLWGGIFFAPFLLALQAFGAELPLDEALLAAYTAHVFTAVAVAAPAAPGFFGVYHFACREALGVFGVRPALAVAYGTVLHLVYWVPVTLAGLLAAIRSGARLADLRKPPLGKAAPSRHR